MIDFNEMIDSQQRAGRYFCLSLDTDYQRISDQVRQMVAGTTKAIYDIVYGFNRIIIRETASLVCAYKFNYFLYSAYGGEGLRVLADTIRYISTNDPDIPIIIDGPFGAGSAEMNSMIVSLVFDELKAHAVVINPLPGEKALKPYFEKAYRGAIVACPFGGSGAQELQDLTVTDSPGGLFALLNGPARSLSTYLDGKSQYLPLSRYTMLRVANHWNLLGNCWIFTDTLSPAEVEGIRTTVGDMTILLDVQDGLQHVAALAKSAFNSEGSGFVVSSSRPLFASTGNDFRNVVQRETENFNREIARARG